MHFEYRDIDNEGSEILDAMASAPQFNKWTFDAISPFCSGNILEIGSGVGNISQFFIAAKKNILLSDIRDAYRSVLKSRFNLGDSSVLNIDIADPGFEHAQTELSGRFDTVFALNVIEHIKNDRLAVANMHRLLKPGGSLVVLVPAYQSLYCGIDTSLAHFRRYNKRSLNELMLPYGQQLASFYFNAAGIPAWWLSGKILRQKTIPEGEMKIYNAFVPVFRLFDRIIANKAGLSVISVVWKTG